MEQKDLRAALRLDQKARVAIVGAGGKTTALFHIARGYESPVVITASTHMGVWQASFADHHLVVTRAEDITGLAGQIEGVTLITGPAGEDERLGPLDDLLLEALHHLANRLDFPLLIEADGARQRPLKAPVEHEPVIPIWVNTVIVVAGLSGLGKLLNDSHVHRPAQFAAISGQAPDTEVTIQSMVKVLANAEGGRKSIPAGVRTVALLNQAEEVSELAPIFEAAGGLVPPYDAALIASMKEKRIYRIVEPVGAIVLAAGGSSRFGQPKMMLPWQGKALVRLAAEAALDGGAAEVVVVTGAADGPVRAALEGLPVQCLYNPNWEEGQSTSLRAGLSELSPRMGSALFLLADQPYINSTVIRTLIERHAQTMDPVIIPRVGDRRANPVLFDRATFPALFTLEGDTGGRAIFDRFPVSYLEWDDPSLLVDIDTPEDYTRLLEQNRL